MHLCDDTYLLLREQGHVYVIVMFSASIQYLEYDIAWKAFIELRKAGERKGKKKKKKEKKLGAIPDSSFKVTSNIKLVINILNSKACMSL